jgi:hypothetical protein
VTRVVRLRFTKILRIVGDGSPGEPSRLWKDS